MGGFAVRSFRKERVSVRDFSELKDMLEVFDQFVVLSRSEEREWAAVCLSEG